MKYIINLTFIFLLTACGGSGGDSIISDVLLSDTKDVLADPDAQFNTYQSVNFIANNDSDLNVTLYVYDDMQGMVARHYIAAKGSAEVAMQIPMAEEGITVKWHARELVHEQTVNLLALSTLNFEGFVE